MLSVWQHIHGHVRIQVTGFGIERFLNMAAYRGVYIWDVTQDQGHIALSVSIKGFKQLKGCAKKTNCHTKIIDKNGLPFVLQRYKKRKVLLGGVAFFILGLYLLSSFIWYVEITGNDHLPQETVMAFLETEGLRVGASKFGLRDRYLRESLLSHFTEISWADVHTRGTRTTVSLVEILPPKEMIAQTTPTHVVAAADGLITHVITWSGAPMVSQGDVVQKGDRLINGILELVPDDPATPYVYVHAYAEVWARRYHPLVFSVPFTYEEKVFTGQSATRRGFSFLFLPNWLLNLPGGGHNFTSYDKITTYTQPGVNGNYPWPVILSRTHYREFDLQQRTRGLDVAQAMADHMITQWIIKEFDFATDIIDRRVSFNPIEDRLEVTATIITHERIDQRIEIPRRP